jgi:hypothetical protein
VVLPAPPPPPPPPKLAGVGTGETCSAQHALHKPRHSAFPLISFTRYEKVLVIDVDVTLLLDVHGMMQAQPVPAMTQWGAPPDYEFNSGVWLLRPSVELYNDVRKAISNIMPKKAQRELLLKQGVVGRGTWLLNDTSVPKRDDPQHPGVQANLFADLYSDQEFLAVFYEILYRAKHGPLYTMPYRYNVRHHSLNVLLDKVAPSTVSSSKFSFTMEFWYSVMQVAFWGYATDDLGKLETGPAIVHSTIEKPTRTTTTTCDQVRKGLAERSLA